VLRVTSVRDFALGGAAGFLTAVVIVLVALIWVPVGGGDDELEPGPLTILSGRDDSVGGQRRQLVQLWNDSHPRNPARIVEVAEAANGVYGEMIAQARNPGVDIFNLDVVITALFADPPSGDPWLRPIDEDRLAENPRDAFLAKPLSTCLYQGKLWGLPFNTDAGLLYYRADEGLQPPFDWAKIRAARQAHPEFTAGYTTQLGEYEGLTVNILEAAWADKASFAVDPGSGEVTLDLAAWNRLVHSLAPGSGLVHPDALDSQESKSMSTFEDGGVLFMRNWPVAYGAMLAADKKLKFGVTDLPGPSVLGGQNLAISARSERPRAAQALIEFLTSRQSQKILFEKGGFAATRAEVYADETVKSDRRYAPLLFKAINNAQLRPVSPNYIAFSERLADEVHKVLAGEQGDLPADFAARLTRALRGK
jgi:multiple sugar transport system substrate-binding protein